MEREREEEREIERKTEIDSQSQNKGHRIKGLGFKVKKIIAKAQGQLLVKKVRLKVNLKVNHQRATSLR